MEYVKRFFKIEKPYTFEMNDVRCIINVINTILIIIYGLKIAYFGLALAILGLIKDLTTDRHINSIVMHLSSMILNFFFISLL